MFTRNIHLSGIKWTKASLLKKTEKIEERCVGIIKSGAPGSCIFSNKRALNS